MSAPKPDFKAPVYHTDDAHAAKLEKSAIGHDSPSEHADNEQNNTLLERQRNPFLGKTEERCLSEMETICKDNGLDDIREELLRGVRYAYNSDNFERLNPTEDERHWIQCEQSQNWRDKWRHTWTLYYVARESSCSRLHSLSDIDSTLRLSGHCPRYGSDRREWCSDLLQP